MAVERHQTTQQKRAEVGHVLHLYLADGIPNQRGMLVDRIHTDGRTDTDMVGNAADMHTDHHLREPVHETI